MSSLRNPRISPPLLRTLNSSVVGPIGLDIKMMAPGGHGVEVGSMPGSGSWALVSFYVWHLEDMDLCCGIGYLRLGGSKWDYWDRRRCQVQRKEPRSLHL